MERSSPGGPPPKARHFSYESLDDVWLKASLTYSWRRRDWRSVRKILFGWGCSYALYTGMLFTFVLYGCDLFEPREGAQAEAGSDLHRRGDGGSSAMDAGSNATAAAAAPVGNTDEFLFAWILSAFQRFVLHEPTIILAAKGLPILFASTFCANVCGESIVNVLTVCFEGVVTCLAQIKG
jgi:hypothetical protein